MQYTSFLGERERERERERNEIPERKIQDPTGNQIQDLPITNQAFIPLNH